MPTPVLRTDIIKRLKRAEGHLRSIVTMLEDGRECLDIAQQMQAVERAIANAKKTLVHDHIDRCLEQAAHEPSRTANDLIREFKEVTKYL
ncbi:MAG: metal-sensing transcriptional repressor [Burkholderiaceae bacterium]|nr:metal-sensing transcriptional repressor [Burkholderiaceae bacterium]